MAHRAFESSDVWLSEQEFDQLDQSKVVLRIKSSLFGPRFSSEYPSNNESIHHILSPTQYRKCVTMIVEALDLPLLTKYQRMMMPAFFLTGLSIPFVISSIFAQLVVWFICSIIVWVPLLACTIWLFKRCKQLRNEQKLRVNNCIKDINKQLLASTVTQPVDPSNNPPNNQSNDQPNDQSNNQSNNQSNHQPNNQFNVSSLSPCYFLLTDRVVTAGDGTVILRDLVLMFPSHSITRSINQSVNQPNDESISLSIDANDDDSSGDDDHKDHAHDHNSIKHGYVTLMSSEPPLSNQSNNQSNNRSNGLIEVAAEMLYLLLKICRDILAP